MSFRGSIYPLFKINKCLDNLYRVRTHLQGSDDPDANLNLYFIDYCISSLKALRVGFL